MTPSVRVLTAAAEHGCPFRAGSLTFQPAAASKVLAFRAKLPEKSLEWFDGQTALRMVLLARADEYEPPRRNREKRVKEPEETMEGDE